MKQLDSIGHLLWSLTSRPFMCQSDELTLLELERDPWLLKLDQNRGQCLKVAWWCTAFFSFCHAVLCSKFLDPDQSYISQVHWSYTVASTINCGCSKMLNHGLNLGFFLSLFKLIPCPIHWIVYVLAYWNFISEF